MEANILPVIITITIMSAVFLFLQWDEDSTGLSFEESELINIENDDDFYKEITKEEIDKTLKDLLP